MKKCKVGKFLKGCACSFLSLGAAVQISASVIYAISGLSFVSAAASNEKMSLKDELSKNGNVVTEYINDEDNEKKTIIWAKGITPPKMGGEDSDFEKEYTPISNPQYLEYVAPYEAGNGWYDVNKSHDYSSGDFNLCFAASTTNSLHWWLDQNRQYVEKYIEANRDNAQIQKLENLCNSFESQKKSGIYDIFLRQFANRKEGYWPDILQDQFINGYYPQPNGATNDSPAARDRLLKEGPDKNGGFFFDVFNDIRLTERRYYDRGYEALSRELKELFMRGDSVLLTFSTSTRAHVVTLWGVEFGENGKVCAVYYSDSDDEAVRGMMRFRFINKGGKAVVTTNIKGESNSVVESIQVLSTGTRYWEKYFNTSKTTLDLVWENTEMVYDKGVKVPSVSASNIAEGDKVTLYAEGGQINAGTYTAKAVLGGEDAYKYQLPDIHTKEFVIKKAPAPMIDFPSAENIHYGQKLSDSLLIGASREYGDFYWEDGEAVPNAGKFEYAVRFEPSELTEQNYEAIDTLSKDVSVTVEKSAPSLTVGAETDKPDNLNEVALTAALTGFGYGDLPTGKVTFTIKAEGSDDIEDEITNIAVENGKANAVWNGAESKKYIVSAAYSGDENYTAVISQEISFDIKKQSQDELIMLPIEAKTYGDEDFILRAEGGSGDGKITFESSDSRILSIENNIASIHKAGMVTITATKAGNGTYNDVKTSVSLSIAKKNLIIRADDKLNVNKGDKMPELTYTVEGLAEGDSFKEPVIMTEAENTDTPGSYQITITGGELSNEESYAVTYIKGQLLINDEKNPPKPEPPSHGSDDDDDEDEDDDNSGHGYIEDESSKLPEEILPQPLENVNISKPVNADEVKSAPYVQNPPENVTYSKEEGTSSEGEEVSENSDEESSEQSDDASSEEALKEEEENTSSDIEAVPSVQSEKTDKHNGVAAKAVVAASVVVVCAAGGGIFFYKRRLLKK